MAEALPRCAPSMGPGTSATTKPRSSPTHDARLGVSVGERVVGDFGRAAEMRAIIVDFRRWEADQPDVGEEPARAGDLDLARLARLYLRGARLVDETNRVPSRRVHPWRP